MINLSDNLEIDISNDSDISDFVKRASRHHWKVGFKFESGHRNPRMTPTGKVYGTDRNFRQIYLELKAKGWDFLDRYFDEVYPYSYLKDIGDSLLNSINEEIGIVVDSIITSKDEIFKINKSIDANYTRMVNARERLDLQQEKADLRQREINEQQRYFYSRQDEFYIQQKEFLDVKRQRNTLLEDLEYLKLYMEENVRITKKGTYDKRARATRQYYKALQDFEYLDNNISNLSDNIEYLTQDLRKLNSELTVNLSDFNKITEKIDKLRANFEREMKRYENSFARQQKVIDNLQRIKDSSWSKMNQKYENSATEFAEEIKRDIVSSARNGTLPMQNIGLAETTIEKRLSVGLDPLPRFWATHQLVESIIVTCKLV